ncbi:DEKNAAC105093, partial [Brettanomyces naardenensis]
MLYTLGKETSGYRPLILLLTSLLIDLRNSLGTEGVDDDIQLTQLRRQIAEWTQNSHLELQTKVTPYMDEVIMNKFTKLFQVVGNSDQLALTMANYMFNDQLQVKKSLFSSPIRCHGSLVDSNSNLNYLEGKIDGIFPSDEKNEPLSDPLKGLKKNVTQNMLPSLQGKLNCIFLKESIEIPLPVFCITTWGYIIDYIDLNTGAAIFTFSLALAAYKMSQGIYKEVSKFKDEYLDDLRVTIDKNLVYLNDKLSQNVNKYGSQLKVKTKLIEQLDAEVENVTSVQKK